MKNTLIIQFKNEDFNIPYEFLLDLEESLIQLFSQSDCAIVDGHDLGNDTMNIFIHPKGSWKPVIDRVLTYLKFRDYLNKAIVAKLIGKSGNIKIIHPVNIDNVNFEL